MQTTREATIGLLSEATRSPKAKPSLNFSLQQVCELLRLPYDEQPGDDHFVFKHIPYARDQRVFRSGAPFEVLYIVHSGFLKLVSLDAAGVEQVYCFPMKGDILGTEGIHTREHTLEATSLSDCGLIALPFDLLMSAAKGHPELEQSLYGILSEQAKRDQSTIHMLKTLNAEARVARFLVMLSERFAGMGYSSSLFTLRMTREEIGSYLGLTLHTVSRTLSGFSEMGLVCTEQKEVAIKDMGALKALFQPKESTAQRICA